MNKNLIRLAREALRYKKSMALVVATGLIYAVAFPQQAMIVRKIFDSFATQNVGNVGQSALYALALALLVAVTRYFHIFTMNKVSEAVVNELRLMLHKKYLELSLSYHARNANGPGALMSLSMSDVRIIQDGMRMIADLFREPLVALFLLGNLFYLNWKLTLGLLVVLPFLLIFLKQISRSLKKYVPKGQEKLEEMTSALKESLDGLRVVQSYNLESEMDKKMRSLSQDYLELRKKIHARVELMSPISELVATFLVLAIFYFYSFSIVEGTSTSGDILAYIVSLLMFNPPLKKLQENYVRIQETIVAAERVYAVLDNDSVVKDSENGQPFPKTFDKVSFRGVWFQYNEKPVLKNINFEIRRGESVAFVGLSGSGKSTLVNLLPRFFEVTKGEIRIGSLPLGEIDLKDLRKNISLVTQDVFLFSDTIKKNILSGDLGRSADDIIGAARAAHAHDFILARVEAYETPVGDRGGRLSGGEKQRISIARAIFKDAPLLILDEATSALDSSSEQEVQRGIDSLIRGRTSLIIAHRLSTVQNCDRIYVMREGEIIAQGTHTSLLSSCEDYRKLCELQGLGGA